MRKIDLSRFKKKAIEESFKQLTKNRYDNVFNLIDEITEKIENGYVSQRAFEEWQRNSNMMDNNSIPAPHVEYIDLKTTLQRLIEIDDSLISSMTDDEQIVFEGNNTLYKPGELKLDDGTSAKLSSIDAKYLNIFAGTSLKWYRILTKDQKGFKEVLLLSKT